MATTDVPAEPTPDDGPSALATTDVHPAPPPRTGTGPERARRVGSDPSLVGGGLWAGGTAVALVVAGLTVARWPAARLQAAPLFGAWGVELAAGVLSLVPVGIVAGLALGHGPRLAERLPWRRLLPAAAAATVAWCVVLAVTAGWGRLTEPLEGNLDYLAVVDRIGSPGEFLRTFGDRVDGYPLHVKGHPPGMPLVLWALDAAGLGGSGWATALVLAGAGVATAAVLVTLRSVAGEDAARRAAPFVAFAPAALWLGTSADALFAGVGAVGCALVVAGARRRHHLAGGVVLGCTAFLSYGLVLLGLVPLAVATRRRDLRPIVAAAAGGVAVLVAFRLAGFWWFDGLAITRSYYWDGVARNRHGVLFATVVNPGALALATGPAVAAGLAMLAARRRTGPRTEISSEAVRFEPLRRRSRPFDGMGLRAGLLAAAALVAVTVADLSQLSRGEVERIWLPFTAFLLTATALLPRRHVRGFLAAQLALAVVVEVAQRQGW
jgi:methylthioxylose transferase